MKTRLFKMIRSIQFFSPFQQYFFYRYSYMFTPAQLSFFCRCMDETRGVDGNIMEIGCAKGHTTVFLNKHLLCEKINKKYYALDTFSGFLEEDVAHEIEKRGKEKKIRHIFSVNKKKWVEQTLRKNHIYDVELVQADAKLFDYHKVSPISFCLIDVDLYQPVKKAIEAIYPLVSKGGIMVIDDCRPNNHFDGALAAYSEFMEAKGLPNRIELGKLGIIQK